jgi:putative transposase
VHRDKETESAPPFQPFNPAEPAAISGHHLPHWTQPGCTYFVTFRLRDSLPKAFAERWYAERREWMRQRGVDVDAEAGLSQGLARLAEADRKEFHERFSAVMERKLDELHGSCLLQDNAHRELVEQALRFFHNERYRLGRYAVLPNHVHALVTPLGTGLKRICYSWKHWSATQINRERGVRGSVWQSESFDHIVRNEEHLERFDTYIARNPERAGLQSGFTVGHGDEDSSPGTP